MLALVKELRAMGALAIEFGNLKVRFDNPVNPVTFVPKLIYSEPSVGGVSQISIEMSDEERIKKEKEDFDRDLYHSSG